MQGGGATLESPGARRIMRCKIEGSRSGIRDMSNGRASGKWKCRGTVHRLCPDKRRVDSVEEIFT